MPASGDRVLPARPCHEPLGRCGYLPPRRRPRPAARPSPASARHGPGPASRSAPPGATLSFICASSDASFPASPVDILSNTCAIRSCISRCSSSLSTSRGGGPGLAVPVARQLHRQRPLDQVARYRQARRVPPVPAPAPIPYPNRTGNGPWSPGSGAASWARRPPQRRDTPPGRPAPRTSTSRAPAGARTSPAPSGRGARSCRNWVLCSSSLSASTVFGPLVPVFGERAGDHERRGPHARRPGPLGDLRPLGRAAIDAAATGADHDGAPPAAGGPARSLSPTLRAARLPAFLLAALGEALALDLGEHQHRGLDALQPGEHGLRGAAGRPAAARGPPARWQTNREMAMPAASARSRMRRHSVSVAITVRGCRLGSGASCMVRTAAMEVDNNGYHAAPEPECNTHAHSNPGPSITRPGPDTKQAPVRDCPAHACSSALHSMASPSASPLATAEPAIDIGPSGRSGPRPHVRTPLPGRGAPRWGTSGSSAAGQRSCLARGCARATSAQASETAYCMS